MKLIRCRKCGTMITTNDTLMQVYMDKIEELGRFATKDKANRPIYLQQAASLRKVASQIMHLTAQTDEHCRILQNELSALTHYIRDKNLVPDEKLSELREQARVRAPQKTAEDEKKIEALYGEFNSALQNKARKDPTAKAVLRRTEG